MKLVLTGDIHLGRSSSRIPDSLSQRQLRSTSAWVRIVDLAIQEKADIVCLSGDIIDEANKFWESIGPLREGVKRLAGSGIQTIAVAGNHDHDVLKDLADQLPPEHFKLLGRKGHWERFTIKLENGEALNIDGWSFPGKFVPTSPLDTYDLIPEPDVPTLGMVHGDLDAPSSSYAPLDLTRLQSLGSGNWLLGHIHAPRLIQGTSWVLYPGSPQALDPGEPGIHGPWILEVDKGRIGLPVQTPLSTVVYSENSFDLTGIENENDLQSFILEGIHTAAANISSNAGQHHFHTSLRITLTGQTSLSKIVTGVSEKLISDLDLPSITVEKMNNRTLPPINLLEYAESGTAAGTVAGILLQLEKNEISGLVQTLIHDTTEKLKHQNKPGNYGVLGASEVTEEQALEYLRESGRALLTELVGQNDGR